MLLLTGAEKVQVVTTTTADIDVHASFMDMTQADPPVVKGTTSAPQNTKINTAATTDVVVAPAASTTRNVKTLHIQNVHASAANVVTVQINTSGTLYVLENVTLLANERIAYVEGQGFEVVDANGITKTNAAAAVFTTKLQSDQSNSTTTLTNVTGLETPCGVGTWIFEYYLLVQSAATTTGHRFSVNHDGTLTSFVAWVEFSSANAAAADAIPDQDIVTATGETGCKRRTSANHRLMP